VHMPAREMGRRAAQFLFERLENPGHDVMQEVMPTELVVRASTVGGLPEPVAERRLRLGE